jgi:DNA ligase-1
MQYLTLLIFVVACAWPNISFSQSLPPLLLAKTYQGTEQLSDYWVSEKYDGVRAYWDGTELLTRTGKKIHAPTAWTAQLPEYPVDGELWIDYQHFDRISGLIRKKHPNIHDWQSVKFMAFDLPSQPGSFRQRYQHLKTQIQRNHQQFPNTPLRLVQQISIDNHRTLKEYLQTQVQHGAEGLMLRKINSLYHSGRSKDLLKVKPYMDAEALVIGHQTGHGKYEGMLGALIVEDTEGQQFKIGTGFSDQQRSTPPNLGATITFRYHGHTKTGLPRFASFLRTRKPE